MLFKVGLELFNNEANVKYGFILGLKELLLLNSISQTNTNKKEKSKQTNKKEEKIKTKPILGLT